MATMAVAPSSIEGELGGVEPNYLKTDTESLSESVALAVDIFDERRWLSVQMRSETDEVRRNMLLERYNSLTIEVATLCIEKS